MSQYLAPLRLGIAGAVIYLGHGETPANTDVFVAGKQNKLGVWMDGSRAIGSRDSPQLSQSAF